MTIFVLSLVCALALLWNWRQFRQLETLEELRQQQAQLVLVNEINSRLVGEPFSERVMDSLCELLRERFDLVLVSIYLVEPKLGLQLLAYNGEGIPEDHTHLALDSHGLAESDGLIATAAKTGQPVYAPDVTAFAGYLQGHSEVCSEFTVPLVAGGNLLGVLNFESRKPDGFDEALRRLLEGVAQQGSLAIQRAQILSRLQDSEQRYLQATAAGNVGMWDWNLEAEEFFMDQVILKAIGLKPGEIDSRLESWIPLFPEDDLQRIAAASQACVRGETDIYALEHRIYHRSGSLRWLGVRGEPIRHADGQVYRLVGTATDITEKKDYELALVEAKEAAEAASDAKSDFLARMSHELRTPLHGVIGSASLLSSMHLDDESTHLVDTIQLSARVLLSTINDILEISKIEAGHLEMEREAFSIIDCVENTIRVVEGSAKEKSIHLDFHLAEPMPDQILGDFIRLRQVLINLIHNAIKFTDQGSVSLDVRSVEQDGDTALLRFAVQDTGSGIPEAEQRRLFDPFTQGDTSASRRHDGTGLGLAICSHLVRLMGGEIWIESEVGRGSTFFFTILADIPSRGTVSMPTPPLAAPPIEPGYADHSPLHVLVAEDNPVNQKVTAMQLRSLGCTVEITSDGLATLEATSQEDFDLVLMDCQMPELNGFDTTMQIRNQEMESGKHLPIVGLTAYATAADRERCLASGMDDYLSKPVTVQDLAAHLARWSQHGSRLPLQHPEASNTALDGGEETVDEGAITRLRELSEACGEDVLTKALALFSRDAPTHLAAMRDHLAAADAEALANAAHSLKGAAETLGAIRLRSLCRELERMGREDRIRHAGPWIDAAKRVLGETLEAFQSVEPYRP